MKLIKILLVVIPIFFTSYLKAQLNFATPICNPIPGVSPVRIISGDFNNDGIIDLASSNRDQNSVSIILGNGNGIFSTINTYSAGTFTQHITTADFNMDGNLDLAAANSQSNDISIFIGLGNGTMTAAIQIPIGIQPMGMQSADFNSDGKIDIAVSLSGDDQIAVLFGNGNGSFSSPIKYQIIGDQPNSMKCADINNDGKIDIITGQIVSRDINIFLNDGSGNFLSPIVALSGIFIDNVVLEAVDFIDNDGNKDILLITIGGSCAAFYGDGNGGFLNGSGVNTGPSLGSSKFIADFNGDGLKDIGGSEIPGTTLMIILGDTGTANFSNYQSLTYQCSIQPIDLLSVDLNADNRPDLIAADNFSQNIVVFINTTPVNIFEIESDSKLQIPFPNPVTNILHFKNDGHIVELCNFLGQKITTTTKEYIEMGSLKTGYYILKTNNDSMIIEKK